MRPTIIGIAGGTASGKTTIAKILYEKTKEFGTVSLIRMDDYYKRRDFLVVNEDGSKNFDHPDSFETDLLLTHLKALQDIHRDFVRHLATILTAYLRMEVEIDVISVD